MLNYRLLIVEEWSKLDPLVNGQGPIPSPESAAVAVAEDEEGRLVGALFVQMTLHMEPLVISPNSRDVVNFRRLQETLVKDAELEHTPFYAFSQDSRVGKMCKLVGMKQLPYRVWFREPPPLPAEETG